MQKFALTRTDLLNCLLRLAMNHCLTNFRELFVFTLSEDSIFDFERSFLCFKKQFCEFSKNYQKLFSSSYEA